MGGRQQCNRRVGKVEEESTGREVEEGQWKTSQHGKEQICSECSSQQLEKLLR